ALGPRRADELAAQLPSLRNPIRTLRLKPAWETAHLIIDLLSAAAPRRIEVAGAVRRMCEVVVGGLDIVAAPGDSSGPALLDLLESLPSVIRTVDRAEIGRAHV